jgi:hypothetical protein
VLLRAIEQDLRSSLRPTRDGDNKQDGQAPSASSQLRTWTESPSTYDAGASSNLVMTRSQEQAQQIQEPARPPS